MHKYDHTIDLLKNLVSINSITGNEGEIAKYIFDYLKSTGCENVSKQKVSAGRYNVIAHKGKGTKEILLYGHIDTVSVCDGWTKDPFATTIQGDRLYGLGAYDMKGGVVALIEAFTAADPTNISLTLALTVDEENNGQGCEVFLKSYKSKNAIFAIVCEPGFTHGLQGIVTGRSGWRGLEIEIKQPSRHFIHYDKSSDLALVFACATNIIESFSRVEEDGTKQFLSLKSINVQCQGMSIPERLVAKYECNILTPEDGQILESQIEKKLNDAIDLEFSLDIDIDVTFFTQSQKYYAPYKQKINTKAYRSLAKALRSVTRRKAIPYFRPSISDENILVSHGIYTLGIGPLGGLAHGANEWVSISSVFDLGVILKKTIENIDL